MADNAGGNESGDENYPEPEHESFMFLRCDLNCRQMVRISSTPDNPWNVPLVAGQLDFDYVPETHSLIPRLRSGLPPYRPFVLPPYLSNLPLGRGPIQLINVPLPGQEVQVAEGNNLSKRKRGEPSNSAGLNRNNGQDDEASSSPGSKKKRNRSRW